MDELLEAQRALTAVERFSQHHAEATSPALGEHYRDLIPLTAPGPGEQYAFEVDLDRCSGCKGCVTACHSLNGLDEDETWREVGFLVGTAPAVADGPRVPADRSRVIPLAQVVTTACHHCADPGCLSGCPVLAYDKDPATGIVRHLDDQCMGCSYCILKCPYEVPKYSASRGIVRKCDLCQGRLAVGEAPACVQGCPNEAIRITRVRTGDLLAAYRPTDGAPPASFLPDSPDPSLTAPATRYVSRHSDAPLRAADHGVPRLDRPHRSLVVLLVFSQAAAGIALTLPAAALARDPGPFRLLSVASLVLLSVGMAASAAHLGRPAKAWRAFLGWRRSWLSREILALNLFAGALTATAAAGLLPFPVGGLPRMAAGFLAAAAGVVAVLASAMVYVDTGRPAWAFGPTVGRFLGTTFLLGAAFTAALFGWAPWFPGFDPGAALPLAAVAATVVRTVKFAASRIAWRAALADPGSPVHLNARALAELLPGVPRWRLGLFAASTVAGLLALLGPAAQAPMAATLSLATTLASELLGRDVFFRTGTARRMPGGIPT